MPIPAPLLNGVRREYSISHLVEAMAAEATMPAERLLMNLVLPPWQRPEVWTVEQKRRFVEGIFLGLGCGYYVKNGLEWDRDGRSLPMSGWLIDGQQRIGALRDFIGGNLVVFGDVCFPALTKPERLRFMRISFPCFELDYTSNEDVLEELYDRLNFGGTPHTAEQRASGRHQGRMKRIDVTKPDEKDYEVEVTLTIRVKAQGVHAAKRVAKEVVPQSGAGITLEGGAEFGPADIRVTAGRQVLLPKVLC